MLSKNSPGHTPDGDPADTGNATPVPSVHGREVETTEGHRAGGRARPGGGQAKVFRRKSCLFCKDKVREVDYKNVEQLRRYTSERGKIRSRRMSGACRRHQRQIAVAIKRAREMALLPYVSEGGGPPSRSRSGERR